MSGKQAGKQSVRFKHPPVISGAASVVGKKEGEGPYGKYFDVIEKDPKVGGDTWEDAEGRLQEKAAQIAIRHSGYNQKEIRYVIAGDLLGQLMASSFGLMGLDMPMFGVYGACSTMGESIALGAMLAEGGYADHVLAMTSSHFASAEKQFRFPLEYGNQRPLSATWTVTGSGGFVVSKAPGPIRIRGITTGKIVDYGMKDPMNMGACMAPAAAQVMYQHFQDYSTQPKDYDAIYTGDLGEVGKQILLKLMDNNGYDISGVYGDCGLEIYENETQDTHSGGSGCACSAVVFASMITKKIIDGTWKRVLFIPTGALMSKTSFNEGESVTGIAHAVLLEKEENEWNM